MRFCWIQRLQTHRRVTLLPCVFWISWPKSQTQEHVSFVLSLHRYPGKRRKSVLSCSMVAGDLGGIDSAIGAR